MCKEKIVDNRTNSFKLHAHEIKWLSDLVYHDTFTTFLAMVMSIQMQP